MEPLDPEKETRVEKCLEEILDLVKSRVDCTGAVTIFAFRYELEPNEVGELISSAVAVHSQQ
jgi:hypothetical protein